MSFELAHRRRQNAQPPSRTRIDLAAAERVPPRRATAEVCPTRRFLGGCQRVGRLGRGVNRHGEHPSSTVMRRKVMTECYSARDGPGDAARAGFLRRLRACAKRPGHRRHRIAISRLLHLRRPAGRAGGGAGGHDCGISEGPRVPQVDRTPVHARRLARGRRHRQALRARARLVRLALSDAAGAAHRRHHESTNSLDVQPGAPKIVFSGTRISSGAAI